MNDVLRYQVDKSWTNSNMQSWSKIAKQIVIISWCDVVWFPSELQLALNWFEKPWHMPSHSAGMCNLPGLKNCSTLKIHPTATLLWLNSTRGFIRHSMAAHWSYLPSRARLHGRSQQSSRDPGGAAQLRQYFDCFLHCQGALCRCASPTRNTGNAWTNLRQQKKLGETRKGKIWLSLTEVDETR